MRSLVQQVVVDSVRDGRPKPATWPPWLRPVGALALAAFTVLLLLTLFSVQVRELLPLTPFTEEFAFPAAVIPFIFFVLTFVVALIQTAALRGNWLLRIVGLMTTTTAFTVSQTMGGITGLVIAAAGVAIVVVLVLLRSGRPATWWEFPLLYALAAAVMLLPLALASDPVTFAPHRGLVLVSLMSTVTIAGLPVMVLAGYASTNVALRVGQWMDQRLSGSVRRSWPWILTVLGGVAVILLIDLIRFGSASLVEPEKVVRILPTMGTAAVLAAPVFLRAWQANRHRTLESVGSLRSGWDPGASGTSFAIAALYLPVPLGFLAQTVGFATGNQDLILRANFLVGVPTIWWYAPIATVLIGVGLWVLGLRRAGRGETAIGLAGAVFLAAAVAELFGIATGWNTQPTISGMVGLGLLLGVLLLATALVARTNPVP
nr:hypothetical protein [Actinomycetales bacterium]